MKLIKLTKAMEDELNNLDEFSMEMVGYLTYTQNYYLFEKNGVKEITSKRVTLIQLQSRMNLTDYEAYVLDRDEAEEALKKVATPVKNKPEPKKKEEAKVAPKPKAIKEEPKKTTKPKDKKKSGK